MTASLHDQAKARASGSDAAATPTTSPLPTADVLDDAGEPHVLAFVDQDAFVLLGEVLPKVEQHAQGDFLDQVIDAAIYGTAPDTAELDPIRIAFERTAERIVTSGDVALIERLLAGITRDDRRLTKAHANRVYSRNIGELKRTIAIVLEREFGPFFVERVGNLRQWGAGLLDRILGRFKRPSTGPSTALARLGLSGLFGTGPKDESA